MTQKLKAVYLNGTFVPEEDCYLPNHTEVELTVRYYQTMNSNHLDPEVRKQILKALLQRMRHSH